MLSMRKTALAIPVAALMTAIVLGACSERRTGIQGAAAYYNHMLGAPGYVPEMYRVVTSLRARA